MKKQTIILFGILVATMSSCVYSLFPIYTEDTLIFKKELVGKWSIDDKGSYLLFEAVNEEEEENIEKNKYKYTIKINEDITMSSNEPLFIMQNGRKIYNEDSIIIIMNERLAKVDEDEEPEPELSKADLDAINDIDMGEVIKEQIEEEKLNARDIDYQGSVSVYEEKSYKLTVADSEGEKESYLAHLVEIGGDIFMDLYPVKEFDSKNISDNFFPVHTFYKVKITEDEFTMIHFDLDKLNKLFESNLIRLRHENVEGTVLITAQPKELQKFIDKYSDDESVFDTVETYKRSS